MTGQRDACGCTESTCKQERKPCPSTSEPVPGLKSCVVFDDCVCPIINNCAAKGDLCAGIINVCVNGGGTCKEVLPRTPMTCSDGFCGTDDSCVSSDGTCQFVEKPEGKQLFKQCIAQVQAWQSGVCIPQRCTSPFAVGCGAWCADQANQLKPKCAVPGKLEWLGTCNFAFPTFPDPRTTP